ncbi:MAG: hypothetical protein AAFW00_27565 [Bacteroidota bacterium]
MTTHISIPMKKETITLTQNNLKVRGYQIHASLERRQENSPFIAVLVLALENEGVLSADDLKEQLLPTMPLRASENMLLRLTNQEYFAHSDSGDYFLTEKGTESAQNEEIWIPEEGVYDVYTVQNAFVDQKVVKLKAEHREIDDRKEELKEDKKLQERLEDLKIELGNEKLRITKIKGKYFENPLKMASLEMNLTPDKATLGIRSEGLSFDQDITSYISYSELREALIRQEFPDQYNSGKDWVAIDFEKDTSFERDVWLAEPNLREETFDRTQIRKVDFQPISQEDANQWFLHLLKEGLNEYFFDEESFRAYQKKKIEPFRSFLPDFVSREVFLEFLKDSAASFYEIAQIQAPIILS